MWWRWLRGLLQPYLMGLGLSHSLVEQPSQTHHGGLTLQAPGFRFPTYQKHGKGAGGPIGPLWQSDGRQRAGSQAGFSDT